MVFGFCFGLLRFRGGECGVGAGVEAREGGSGLCGLNDEDGGGEFFEGEEDNEAAVDLVAGEVDACVCGGIEDGACGMNCAPVARCVTLETGVDDGGAELFDGALGDESFSQREKLRGSELGRDGDGDGGAAFEDLESACNGVCAGLCFWSLGGGAGAVPFGTQPVEAVSLWGLDWCRFGSWLRIRLGFGTSLAPVGGHGFDLIRGVVIGAVIWHKKNRVLLRNLLLLRQIAASLIATEAGAKRFGISSDISGRKAL